MPPVGFEPTISAGVRLQTNALDHAANGTGIYQLIHERIALKGVLKFTLKQLQHVSM